MSSARGAFLDVEPDILAERLSVVGGPSDPSDPPPGRPLADLTMPAEAAAREKRDTALEITPKPAVCCKTRDKAGAKVFVNVCTSAEIPAPPELSERELRELLQSEAQAGEFRVPMSLGEAHKELDKTGGPCTAYDVVVHPRFFAQVDDSLLFKTFFVTVMIEAIEGKFGVELDKNQWVTLRNKKYLGKMPRHFVRRRDLPMVQECYRADAAAAAVSARDSAQPLITEIETKRSAPMAPPHTLQRRPDGRLVVTFELPAAVKAADQLSLEVGEDRLVLAAEAARLLADVFLPDSVQPDSARAVWSAESRRLAVSLAPAAPT